MNVNVNLCLQMTFVPTYPGANVFPADDHLVQLDNRQLKQMKSIVYVAVCILLPMSVLPDSS